MNNVRSQLSKKNPYYLPKYRYLELKNFCLQFPDWEKDLKYASYLESRSFIKDVRLTDFKDRNRVEAMAILEEAALKNVNMVRDTINKVTGDKDTKELLWKGITEGKTYDKMIANGVCPVVSRHEYYNLYRKFFYLLSEVR